MATVGNLFLSMSIQAEQVDKGVAKLESDLKRTGKSIESSMQPAGKSLADLGVKSAGSVAGIGAMTAATGGFTAAMSAVSAVTSAASLALDGLEMGFSAVGGVIRFITAPFRAFIGVVGEAVSEVAGLTKQFLGLKTGLEGINVGVEFERQISRVKALTGATGAEFDKLKAKAREIGSATEFSSGQAATAMASLAQSGFKPTEILEASMSVIQLASTAQVGMVEAADIAAKIIRGMNLNAADFAQTADLLAMASTNSNTTIGMLGEAFKYVGPVAVAAKKDMVEITAAIMALSDAGLQGDMAGTTIAQMMMKIGDQSGEAQAQMKKLGISFSDAAGNIKSIPDIIDHIGEKIAHLSLEEKLETVSSMFGARAGRGILTFLGQGGDRLRERMKLLGDSTGKAAAVATIQLDNVWGALQMIQSAWEGLLEGIYLAFADDIKTAVDSLSSIIGELAKGIPDALAAFQRVGSIVAPIFDDMNKALYTLIYENAPGWRAMFDGFVAVAEAAAKQIKSAWDTVNATLAMNGFSVEGVKQKMVEIGVAIEFAVNSIPELWNYAMLTMSLGMAILEAEVKHTFEERIPRAIAIAPVVAVGVMFKSMAVMMRDVTPALMQWLSNAWVSAYLQIFDAVAKANVKLVTNLKDNFQELIVFMKTMGQSGGNFTLPGMFGEGLPSLTIAPFDLAKMFPDREMTDREKELREQLEKAGIKLNENYNSFLDERIRQLMEGMNKVVEKADETAKNLQGREAFGGPVFGPPKPGVPSPPIESKTTEAVFKGSREAIEKATQFKLGQEDNARADAQKRTADNTKRAADTLDEINQNLAGLLPQVLSL
jgi:TP901 family phage tail tape measure protein